LSNIDEFPKEKIKILEYIINVRVNNKFTKKKIKILNLRLSKVKLLQESRAKKLSRLRGRIKKLRLKRISKDIISSNERVNELRGKEFNITNNINKLEDIELNKASIIEGQKLEIKELNDQILSKKDTVNDLMKVEQYKIDTINDLMKKEQYKIDTINDLMKKEQYIRDRVEDESFKLMHKSRAARVSEIRHKVLKFNSDKEVKKLNQIIDEIKEVEKSGFVKTRILYRFKSKCIE